MWLLGYCVAVIVFGAFVRATNSGDGCGAHWPLCNGEFIPLGASAQRLIEFSHRASSGLFGLLTFAMLALALRSFSPGHPVRKAMSLAVVFTIFEALIGAVLVKRGLVAENASMERAAYMSAHLVNTFLLLGSLAAAAHFGSGGARLRLKGQGAIGGAIVFSLVAVLLLGASGAVTALGDTLFPSKSLAEGLRQDFSPAAHFLIRLRLLHPLIATSVGLFLLLLGGLLRHFRPSPDVLRFSKLVAIAFGVELAAGLVNLWLLAPVWMQLVHLALADAMWLALVLLSLSALSEAVVPAEDRAPDAAFPSIPATRISARAAIGQYVALTKPRVISLLLFTTLTAMFMAAGGWPGGWLFLAVAVGGYCAAGSANAINMVIDRDIDAAMKRTATRPTVTRAISAQSALLFAFCLEAVSFGLLWGAANLLTAILALAGLVFYVTVYTLVLKRRSWHNIVIGGAAGSFPPLVGWVAVTNELTPFAWILFAIIFVWTPVHFWALALLIKDEYASAGVPMLPVVRGERATVIQIGLYAVLTAAISVLPMLQPHVGMLYLPVVAVLNVVLLLQCFRLYQKPERPQALVLFKYSMVYLAALFLTLAMDRTFF